MEENDETLKLGLMLGQRRAFGMIAGRCSAAQAESLRKIRDEKLYLKFADSWEEYCPRFLNMNKRSADRAIALLKKHGPLYFEVAALTGISPAEYARIAPAIQSDGIHAGGEVIALIPENAQRAMEAVSQLQKEAEPQPAAPAPSADELMQALEKKAAQLCAEFVKSGAACASDDLERVYRAVYNVQKMFQKLEHEIQ
ncbi:MAG TPA: hypothetical protein VKE70_26385 [Candidatus Solibacter sp.]|nr:hypothetical protein [Candidatus Solibacter sp.]